jgi:transcription factor C subunit 6
MRTRESNQNKRYTAQKYDFDDSDDEVKVASRRRAASDDDDNFDEGAAAAAESQGEDDDVEQFPPPGTAPGSDLDLSDADAPKASKTPRRRSKPARAAAAKSASQATGYLDIEPMPTDGHPLRGYAGPYDRSFRGQVLVNCWYGPEQDHIELMQDMLYQWQDCTVLPPKPMDGAIEDTRSPWVPGFAEKEARLAESWLDRMKGHVSQVNAWSALSAEDSWPYRMPSRQLPVLLGPYPEQLDVKFAPGDACPLSQTCIPLNPSDPTANIPKGWLLDAGGLVISMDWAPRRVGNATQLLALAVIPHADHEPYDFEEESTKPDFERFGVVQLWEFMGKRGSDNVVRPSAQKPKLKKTLCFGHGRARRARWSPIGDYLAVLCGDGNVYIVQPGEDGNGDYGMFTD